jgi:hypothetical protein
MANAQVILPAGATPDGQPVGQTLDGYGRAWSLPVTAKDWGAAAEGSYFTAVSGATAGVGVPGTGIIGHAAPTTFDQTKPYLLVYNGSSKMLWPSFLRLHDTVVSVGGTRMQFTVVRDVGNLYSSGGTAMTVNSTNSEAATAAYSGVVITQGAVVCSAATSNAASMGNYCLRGTIDVVEDTYTFVWGAPDGQVSASRVATVMDIAQPLPPMGIGPGKCLKIHQWQASQSTGPTFEAVFGFILR